MRWGLGALLCASELHVWFDSFLSAGGFVWLSPLVAGVSLSFPRLVHVRGGEPAAIATFCKGSYRRRSSTMVIIKAE